MWWNTNFFWFLNLDSLFEIFSPQNLVAYRIAWETFVDIIWFVLSGQVPFGLQILEL